MTPANFMFIITTPMVVQFSVLSYNKNLFHKNQKRDPIRDARQICIIKSKHRAGCIHYRRTSRKRVGNDVPVCHLDLFEHGRSHVGLPASRYGLSHEHLVVGADLLYMYVEFGVDERFGRAIGVGHRHHAGHVLKIALVFHLYLSQTAVGVPDFQDQRKFWNIVLKQKKCLLHISRVPPARCLN